MTFVGGATASAIARPLPVRDPAGGTGCEAKSHSIAMGTTLELACAILLRIGRPFAMCWSNHKVSRSEDE